MQMIGNRCYDNVWQRLQRTPKSPCRVIVQDAVPPVPDNHLWNDYCKREGRTLTVQGLDVVDHRRDDRAIRGNDDLEGGR